MDDEFLTDCPEMIQNHILG